MCPEKQKKACQGRGQGTLLLQEWPAVPFVPQASVVRVNLSHLRHNAVDTAGRCLHQVRPDFINVFLFMAGICQGKLHS